MLKEQEFINSSNIRGYLHKRQAQVKCELVYGDVYTPDCGKKGG
jgi:hypothetical protein